jgi:hypothetical protein
MRFASVIILATLLPLAACSSGSNRASSATTRPSTSTAPQPTRPSASPRPCRSMDLTGRGGREGEERGAHGDIEMTNVGSAPCVLDLRGATLTLTSQQGRLRVDALQEAGPVRRVWSRVLGKNRSADVVSFWSNWCGPNPGSLSAALNVPATGGSVTVPFNGPPNGAVVPRCDDAHARSTVVVIGLSV